MTVNRGKSVNGEVIIEMFKKEIEDDRNNKPRTRLYKREVLTALKKSWPELYSTDIAKVSQKDCNDWAARYGREYSPTRCNGALGILSKRYAELERAPVFVSSIKIEPVNQVEKQ